MKPVERTGSSQGLPSPRREAPARAVEEAAPSAAERDMRRGTSGHAPARQSCRPAAAFLAQYVDQNFPWGRAPLRKEGRRLRATRAYILADMLPDLLAETLRMRAVDENL